MPVWAFKLIRREPLKAKAQAVSVEEDANTWGAVWHESLESRALPYACSRLKELTTSGKVDPKLSCVSVKAFRYAAKHYSARKALGIDGWRPAELARLPDRCLGMFVRCINQYVIKGSYDEYLCVSIMALLAKPQGGFRCVAKTPMWYRLWRMARRPIIKNGKTPSSTHGIRARRASKRWTRLCGDRSLQKLPHYWVNLWRLSYGAMRNSLTRLILCCSLMRLLS